MGIGTEESTEGNTLGKGWNKDQGFGKTHGQQLIPGGAYRANQGKIQWELIPTEALEEVAKVFTYGAQKYDPDNWRKGFPWRSVFGSGMRHMQAWLSGEDNDEESGLPHLAHAACNMLFLLQYARTGVGVDDRWKGNDAS